jgi:hypothetical protein
MDEKPEFEFYDVNPFIEAGAGEAFYFRWRGTEYFVECWAARNAGGQDIYAVETDMATIPWSGEADEDEIDGRFDEALANFRGEWDAAWSTYVLPALEKAKEKVVPA